MQATQESEEVTEPRYAEQILSYFELSIMDLLDRVRRKPMSEDELRQTLNDLHFFRKTLKGIDPDNPKTAPLPAPLLPPAACRDMKVGAIFHLAELGFSPTATTCSIDEVLPRCAREGVYIERAMLHRAARLRDSFREDAREAHEKAISEAKCGCVYCKSQESESFMP